MLNSSSELLSIINRVASEYHGNDALTQALRDLASNSITQSGTLTLATGGQAIVTGVSINTGSKILLTYNTFAGTAQGQIAAPSATRTTGEFVVLSSSTDDRSTIDWVIVGLSTKIDRALCGPA